MQKSSQCLVENDEILVKISMFTVELKCFLNLLTASKKDEVRVKEFSKEIDDRNGIIEGLKNELEERKLEIEDLTKQIEDGMESKRGLLE